MRTTYMASPADVQHNWFVVDAAGKPLGRVATQVAQVLRGKHKPTFTPHLDCGDFVIVVNAEKIVLTGNKLDDKLYTRYSGYLGGLKTMTYRQLLAKHPERAMEKAVRGMLPHNRLGRRMIKKLKVYAGAEHPHAAQQPEQLNI